MCFIELQSPEGTSVFVSPDQVKVLKGRSKHQR